MARVTYLNGGMIVPNVIFLLTLSAVASHPAGDSVYDVQSIALKNGSVVRAKRLHQGAPVLDQSLVWRFDTFGEIAALAQ